MTLVCNLERGNSNSQVSNILYPRRASLWTGEIKGKDWQRNNIDKINSPIVVAHRDVSILSGKGEKSEELISIGFSLSEIDAFCFAIGLNILT